jgi:cell division protein ZapD
MPRPTVILYEYPLNETTRTLLRLERLFARLDQLVQREAEIDHHYALMTVFEVLEVLGRSDLKGDLMRELDKQRHVLAGFRSNPAVQVDALNALLVQFDHAFDDLNALQGKLGAELSANDWLMGLRGRANIPGGMFEFDTPSYHAWLQNPAPSRRKDIYRWTLGLRPVALGCNLLMRLLRESGQPVRAAAVQGLYQQNLPQGRGYQLLRLRLDPQLNLVPEITGHRLLVSVRFMRADAEGKLRVAGEDISFELAFCV